MAQDNFINATASTVRDVNSGSYGHTLAHASASAADATFSWDHTKFTTKSSIIDVLNKAAAFIKSRGDIPA